MNLEVEILKFLSERHVVPKRELLNKFSSAGKSAVMSALNSLKTQGFVSIISPMGPETVVVTRYGLEEAEKL